ncbi:molybdopterin molybdotransferase MoeA [Microbacterium murale]|uniref:Molybdopterin molybdenumtransferase n=1 Tax=Microbacterium murale TaxID=1081040 RepID=A0ABU0P7V1_9MICO|nr:gephyrin-like molybdotransferase Glp [Microbacterium murale]MDQ0642761.1 molybdopterin molybdotransferase [Microbacterium murale]
MITIEEHLAGILQATHRLPSVPCGLADAQGLVLAANVTSRWPVPLFDNSAMDGYAVRSEDATAGAILTVVADVAAGSDEDPAIGPGEAVRIMTGAAIPSDADAVVPLEQTDLGTAIRAEAPERITVLVAPAPGAHIRRRGQDASAGAVSVASGARLGPWQLSAIASAGIEQVTVHRAPRVAIISTGSELIAPSGTPRRGQIPESNSVLLSAAVREAGAIITSAATVADDPPALRRALDATDADVVILSGGASVGAFDVVKAVLGEERGVRFSQVAMQPGKPQGFGVLDEGMLAFCLPGNPVSVAASFEVFVRPALRQMAGFAVIDRPRVIRTAGAAWTSPKGRVQILPAVFDDEIVRPATSGGSGSHLVTSLAAATAFAVIPAETVRVEEGEPVTVMVLA